MRMGLWGNARGMSTVFVVSAARGALAIFEVQDRAARDMRNFLPRKRLSLLFIASGSMMISKTLRIPKP